MSCFNLGLTLKDLDLVDIGMMIDLVTTHNNIMDDVNDDKPKVRQATQEDFDRF